MNRWPKQAHLINRWPKQAHLKVLRARVKIYDRQIANHREDRYQTKELARETLDRWVLTRAEIKAEIGELTRPVNAPPRCGPGSGHQGGLCPGPRCRYHIARIQAGWRPGRRVAALGYYESAEWYGVKIWEYLDLIAPLLRRVG